MCPLLWFESIAQSKTVCECFFTNWSVYQKHRYKSMQRLLFDIDLFIILQRKQLAFLAMSMCLFYFEPQHENNLLNKPFHCLYQNTNPTNTSCLEVVFLCSLISHLIFITGIFILYLYFTILLLKVNLSCLKFLLESKRRYRLRSRHCLMSLLSMRIIKALEIYFFLSYSHILGGTYYSTRICMCIPAADTDIPTLWLV